MGKNAETLALRGRIVEKYGTQREFAKEIGRSEPSVIAKLSGRAGFYDKDIVAWADALDIATEDIGRYFFPYRLSKG